MKKLAHLIGLLCATAVSAQEPPSQPASSHSGWWNGNPSFVVPIREVSVTARRPMKEIGVQQTKLDTTVLHENIALSMADVLTFNTSIFVKQYGRATLSTVAFRGTSPSHTQVTWNGMRINSPMLGMTDFSMIPSYFIDDATLLHGTSSVNMTGGGLGGAVALSTRPAETRGFNMQYVQGIGSFSTFDEFLRLTYGSDRWQTSTRVVYSSSSNDFRYRNYNKKMNIYDDDRNIIGTYYPVERNKCGDFHDLHVLQEAYYNTGRGDRLGLQAWYIHSRRGVPMLNVDYRSDTEYRNEQCEQTFRSILSWDHWRKNYKIGARAGYIHTRQTYDFSQDKGNGDWAEMIRSRSFVNTLYGSVEGEYYIGKKWLFTANVSVHQHFVKSKDMLLLSRIENGQYTEMEDVSVDEILDELLPDLMDIYEHKQVRLIRKREEQPFIIRCNHSLAQILVSNLVKNSLLHNREGGELQVFTTPASLVIRNTGDAPLDGEKLFRRFYHGMDGKKDSTGLGLAIARSIALSSSLKLTYEWQDGMHTFRLVKESKIYC